MQKRQPDNNAAPRPALGLDVVILVSALTVIGAVLYESIVPSSLNRLVLELAAVLLIVAAGFLSARMTAWARARGPVARKQFVRKDARPLSPMLESARRNHDRLYSAIANIDWWGDWLPLIVVAGFASGALWTLTQSWKLLGTPAPSAILDEWVCGLLVAAAFPVLVLERHFAGQGRAPDAPALSKLLRLMLLDLLGLGVVFLLLWLDLSLAAYVERAVILVTGLVAAELLLRVATYLFMPLPALELRRSHADSLAAGLIRLQPPSLSAMSASVSQRFGIDLGRSWALGYIRRATFPALLSLGICAWLLTGVTALDLNQRAIYEAFGRPQAVFHSGLHVHLPWPFGILRPLEYGAVREIPIVFASEDGTTAEAVAAPGQGSIEGEPPASDDRLWDASHPSEASYLVASNRNGRENFEIVNIDLRILYRVGLSDAAAYQSMYAIDAPEALIRAAAGRMLARYFARYTIPDVLGQNREAFIRGFQGELQSRLDQLSSGVDILGVVVEAIHPPPATASAYQGVQAAAIRSLTAIATASGDATRAITQAKADGDRMRADATASAAEMVDQAKTDTIIFLSDVEANRRDGVAFLFERRLGSVNAALLSSTPVTIIDHRIPANAMPTLDLRPASARNTPPPFDDPP